MNESRKKRPPKLPAAISKAFLFFFLLLAVSGGCNNRAVKISDVRRCAVIEFLSPSRRGAEARPLGRVGFTSAGWTSIRRFTVAVGGWKHSRNSGTHLGRVRTKARQTKRKIRRPTPSGQTRKAKCAMTFYDVTWKLAIGNFYRLSRQWQKQATHSPRENKKLWQPIQPHRSSSVGFSIKKNRKRSELNLASIFHWLFPVDCFQQTNQTWADTKKKQRKSCWVEILHRRHFPIVPLFFTLQSIIRRSIYYTLQKNDSFSSYNVNLMNIVRDDDE